MKIALFNATPKVKDGNSAYLLRELKQLTKERAAILEFSVNPAAQPLGQFAAICDCDALVFAFPLYVDAIPSHLLRFLESFQAYLNAEGPKDIMVYAVVNCGFCEGRQNYLAIDLMKNWCRRAGLIWGQGLGTGAGEMLGGMQEVPLGHGPKKNLGKAFGTLAENILKRVGGNSMFISPNLPRFVFVPLAHAGWRQQARRNGLTKKDLFRK